MGLTDYLAIIIVVGKACTDQHINYWKTYQSFLVKGSTTFFLAPFFPPIFSPLFLPTAILLQMRIIFECIGPHWQHGARF